MSQEYRLHVLTWKSFVTFATYSTQSCSSSCGACLLPTQTLPATHGSSSWVSSLSSFVSSTNEHPVQKLDVAATCCFRIQLQITEFVFEFRCVHAQWKDRLLSVLWFFICVISVMFNYCQEIIALCKFLVVCVSWRANSQGNSYLFRFRWLSCWINVYFCYALVWNTVVINNLYP